LSAPECHASNRIEIIELWLSIVRLPKYLFGACHLDFGFLWRQSQRAFKACGCAAKASVVRQPTRLWHLPFYATETVGLSFLRHPQYHLTIQFL